MQILLLGYFAGGFHVYRVEGLDVIRDILFKIYNCNNQKSDWIDMIVQQRFNDRVIDCSQIKVGENILLNI